MQNASYNVRPVREGIEERYGALYGGEQAEGAVRSQGTQDKPMRQRRSPTQGQYDDFEASQLFCPKCRQAVPVRKRLLLVLPQGEKYDYLCAYCSTPVGEKLDTNTQDIKIIS